MAQYGDAYHKPNEYALQEQKWRASRPINTGSSYSSSSGTRRSVMNPMTLDEYYSLRKKNSSRTVDPKEKELEAKNAAPMDYYDKIAAKYRMDAQDIAGLKHWDMAKPFEMSFTAKGLHKGEATYLSRLLYKVVSTNKGYEVVYVPNQNILNTGSAYAQFQKEKATGSFEQLMDYVFDFRYASLSALLALDKIQERFPEKKDIILMARVFPILYANKSLLHTHYTTKEMATINSNLELIYNENPQAAFAEDNYVGYIVGYNEASPFLNLFDNALKKKDFTKAREVLLVSFLSDSTNFKTQHWRFANKLRDYKLFNYKAPKVPILTAEDVIAVHHHNKNAPGYKPTNLILFFYKLPKDQQLRLIQEIGLSEEEYNTYLKNNVKK